MRHIFSDRARESQHPSGSGLTMQLSPSLHISVSIISVLLNVGRFCSIFSSALREAEALASNVAAKAWHRGLSGVQGPQGEVPAARRSHPLARLDEVSQRSSWIRPRNGVGRGEALAASFPSRNRRPGSGHVSGGAEPDPR